VRELGYFAAENRKARPLNYERCPRHHVALVIPALIIVKYQFFYQLIGLSVLLPVETKRSTSRSGVLAVKVERTSEFVNSERRSFGFLKRRVNGEEGTDARHLQQRNHLGVHRREQYFSARLLRRDVSAHQSTQTGGVDEWHTAEINNDVGRGLCAHLVLKLEYRVEVQWTLHA
jgi:hypothetical protein